LLLLVVFVVRTSFTMFCCLSPLVRSLIAATTHGPFPLDLQRLFSPAVPVVRVCPLFFLRLLRLLLSLVVARVVRLFISISNFRLLTAFRVVPRFITRCSRLWASRVTSSTLITRFRIVRTFFALVATTVFRGLVSASAVVRV